MTIDRVAVIPYRYRDGRLEVLMVTSRGTGRWIFPKGHIEPHLGPAGSALLEAFEEAGVKGSMQMVPLGTYESMLGTLRLNTAVYMMRVEVEMSDWPEASQRIRRWMLIREALEVAEEGIRPLVHVAGELLH